MKRISRPIGGAVGAVYFALALFAALQPDAAGREPAALPQFHIQKSPVNRDARAVSSYAPIIKRAEPSVVNIYSTRTIHLRDLNNPLFQDPFLRRFFGGGQDGQNPRTFTRKEQSLGSGVIVSDDGYILTANHVVQGADTNGVKVALPSDGKEYTAKIVGTDPPTDVAVLKIDATNLPAIIQADSDRLEVGDVVLAIGNPFKVGQSVTMGIVSALGRSSLGISQYEDFIQTDAAINPGNSGGALVDAEGRLIGINTAIVTRSGGYQGVGFAVPINLARNIMERLIQYGKVTRGYLGVSLQPEITPDLVQEFNLPDQNGAMVGGVMADTPAAKAGLKSGDVIRTVNGKQVTDRQQLRLMISQTPPGTKVTLKILRSEPGRKPVEKSVTVTLGTLPTDLAGGGAQMGPRQENAPDRDSLEGVEVADLDSDVRQQFHIPRDVHGALVASVEDGSNAAQAGLQEGDVILSIDRHPVRNADQAVDLSRKATRKRILLRIWRAGESFYLTVDNTKHD